MRLEFDLNVSLDTFVLQAAGQFDLVGVTALFGPSGAGKTTVLEAIAGHRRGLGRVSVDGKVLEDDGTFVPPWRRPVGIVFQQNCLFEHLSVRDNLRFAERRADGDGPAVVREEVISACGLDVLMDRRPDGLSGGEMRRVAIARALLGRPRVLLLDEPLSGIDRQGKAPLLQLIGELPQRFGVPVVYVSHVVEEIARVADTLLAIRDGRIVGFGALERMLEDLGPDVTGYFEAGVLLSGEVARRLNDHALCIVRIGDTEIAVPDAPDFNSGDRVRLRIRSRDVGIALKPLNGVSIRNQIPARVVSIEPEAGAHVELRLDAAGQALRARITRLSAEELKLVPGMTVFALIKTVTFDRRLGPAA